MSVHSSEQVCASEIPFEGFRTFTDASAVVPLSVQEKSQQGQSACSPTATTASRELSLSAHVRCLTSCTCSEQTRLLPNKQEAALQALAGERIRCRAQGDPLEAGVNSVQALTHHSAFICEPHVHGSPVGQRTKSAKTGRSPNYAEHWLTETCKSFLSLKKAFCFWLFRCC